MKNMSKYGIKITKPWSKEMYDHNDKVSNLMKAEILLSIKNNKNNWDILNELMVLCVVVVSNGGHPSMEMMIPQNYTKKL